MTDRRDNPQLMKPKLWVVAGAGVAAMAGAVYLAAHQPPDRPTEPDAVLTVVLGASLLGSGLVSWRARPENRLGPVMVLTAFGFFASQLTEATPPWMYTLGTAVQYLWLIGFLYLLLDVPVREAVGPARPLADGGRRRAALPPAPGDARRQQGGPALPRLPGQPHPDRPRQPGGAQPPRPAASGRLGAPGRSSSCSSSGAGCGPAPARRRAVAPVLVAGCATFVALAATATLDLFGDPLNSLPANVFFYLSATVPIAVMYVFLQRQLARGGVAGLVVELGTPGADADLRQALARTLGDPSLELAFWFPAERCYVDGDGVPVRLPEGDGGRRATLVERDGQPIAALLHDAVPRRRRRARALGVRGGEPRAGERAPPGRAAGAAGRAAGIAGAAGRRHRRRAPPDRARPARRHPAAARVDRDVARAARVQAARRRRARPGRCCARRARR